MSYHHNNKLHTIQLVNMFSMGKSRQIACFAAVAADDVVVRIHIKIVLLNITIPSIYQDAQDCPLWVCVFRLCAHALALLLALYKNRTSLNVVEHRHVYFLVWIYCVHCIANACTQGLQLLLWQRKLQSWVVFNSQCDPLGWTISQCFYLVNAKNRCCCCSCCWSNVNERHSNNFFLVNKF